MLGNRNHWDMHNSIEKDLGISSKVNRIMCHLLINPEGELAGIRVCILPDVMAAANLSDDSISL